MALSSVKKAFTSKPAYASDPNAAMLMEMCRKATAKDAFQPDQNIKQLITFDILRRRLNMENPHKQWLAVDLVRFVLGQSNDRLRPFRGDLIREVARVADRPNKKGSLPAQQNARRAALEYLQSLGQEGHQALTMVQSMQRGASGRAPPMHPGMQQAYNSAPPYQTTPRQDAGGATSQGVAGQSADQSSPAAGTPPKATARPQIANMPQATGNTMTDVKMLIETSDSHSALLRELLFTSPENGGTGKVREDARNDPLVSEVKAEILQVKEMFPQLMDKLSQDSSAEAEALMARAIASFDELNSCLEMAMQAEIVSPTASQAARNAQAQEPDGASSDEDGGADHTEPTEEEAHAAEAIAGASVDASGAQAFGVEQDLLAFDSGPVGASSGAPDMQAQKSETADPFAPRERDDSDPFGAGGGTGGDTRAADGAPAPIQPPTGSANPFSAGAATGGSAAAPAAGATGGSASAPPGNNPFGGNAFGSGAVPAPVDVQQGSQGLGPGAPSPQGSMPNMGGPGGPPGGPPGGFQGGPSGNFQGGPSGNFQGGPSGGVGPYYGQQQQQQHPGGPPGYGGYGGPPGYGQAPPGYGGYGGPPQGFGGGHTGYSGGPTGPYGGQPGYGGPPHGFGGPSPTGGPPQYGMYGAPSPGGPGGPGGPQWGQQQQQPNPFGGAGNTSFHHQQPPRPGFGPGGFGASATGMPAPGYQPQQQANPFATSSTGAPSWNPNVNRDTFTDLITEHQKMTNPSAPMSAPMRQQK